MQITVGLGRLRMLSASATKDTGMLILTRREGEVVRIGDNIEVVVAAIQGTDVRLGIRAPRDVVILREELLDARVIVDGQLIRALAVGRESIFEAQEPALCTTRKSRLGLDYPWREINENLLFQL